MNVHPPSRFATETPPDSQASVTIRDAQAGDVPKLDELEKRCFETDRLSARSMLRFLTKKQSTFLVDEDESGHIRGYALVLYHKNTSLARLYSIAVESDLRGKGIARALMQACEARALEHGATRMRLEVHQNNEAAQGLYRSMGYRAFAVHHDYYEDHADAVRMEKLLAPHLARDVAKVPYYAQTLNFTCGPACLIMAMKAQAPELSIDRRLELELWREATTIFMTAGHGGCGALGLALAAHRRGFGVDVALSDETEMFTASVRDEAKKDVIRLVEESFLIEANKTDIPIRTVPHTPDELCQFIKAGYIPIVLISAYRLSGEKEPHWVVLTAFDDHFIYVNDPDPDPEQNRFDTDCIGIPIRPDELQRMMRFGARKHFASVIVKPQEP